MRKWCDWGGGQLLSVIIPTRGRPSSLIACLDSLRRAKGSVDQFEVIVVDDGSEPPMDPSALAAGKPEMRVRLLRQAKAGAAAARNRGAREAKGQLLIFLDDDCEVARDWIWAYRRAVAAAPGRAVGGRSSNGVPNRLCSVASQIILDATHRHWNRDTANSLFFASLNVAFPGVGFREIGGFDESFPYAEDRDICQRWLESGRRMVYAPDAHVVHHRRLSLPAFWRQHFRYGRGAWHLHHALVRRGKSGIRLHGGLYGSMLCMLTGERPRYRLVALAALLFLSQAAYACGMAVEKLNSRAHVGA